MQRLLEVLLSSHDYGTAYMLKWEDLNESITNICTAVQKLQVFLEQGTSAHPISPSMQWIMHHEEPEQICHAGSSNMQLHSGRY